MRRRVRKSRQKEAAGATDAGLMQIEWGEGGVWKFAGVVKTGGERGGGQCNDELMAEVDVGRDIKKMCGWQGDTLRRDALKRSECGV